MRAAPEAAIAHLCSVPEQFRDVLLTNAIGPFLVIKALLPLIMKSTKKQVLRPSAPGRYLLNARQAH